MISDLNILPLPVTRQPKILPVHTIVPGGRHYGRDQSTGDDII